MAGKFTPWFLSFGNVTVRTCKVSSSSSGPASFISEMLGSGVPCLELYFCCLPFFSSILSFLFFLVFFTSLPFFLFLPLSFFILEQLGTLEKKELWSLLQKGYNVNREIQLTQNGRPLVLHFSTYHLLATARSPVLRGFWGQNWALRGWMPWSTRCDSKGHGGGEEEHLWQNLATLGLNQGLYTMALLTSGLENSSLWGLSCALWGASSIPGRSPLDASSTPTVVTTKTVSSHCQMFPGG